MNKKLECVVCGGETKPEKVSLTFKRFGQEFIYHDIKADVCLKCGEKFLNGPQVLKIEEEIENKVVQKAA